MGEENQFYYNTELKRWLIRGEEHLAQQEEAPPPPPAAAAATAALAGGHETEKRGLSPAVGGGMRRMRSGLIEKC